MNATIDYDAGRWIINAHYPDGTTHKRVVLSHKFVQTFIDKHKNKTVTYTENAKLFVNIKP